MSWSRIKSGKIHLQTVQRYTTYVPRVSFYNLMQCDILEPDILSTVKTPEYLSILVYEIMD